MTADLALVGWRERDWARFTDEERGRLFGSGGSSSYIPPSTPLTSAEHGNRVRAVVWSAVAAAVIGVGGFGYSQRRPAPVSVPTSPAVVYGTAMTSTAACVNELLDAQSRQWRCLSEQVVSSDTRIVAPQPVAGSCDHVLADQSRGVWVCVASAPTA